MIPLRRGWVKRCHLLCSTTNKPLGISISLDYCPLLVCIRISFLRNPWSDRTSNETRRETPTAETKCLISQRRFTLLFQWRLEMMIDRQKHEPLAFRFHILMRLSQMQRLWQTKMRIHPSSTFPLLLTVVRVSRRRSFDGWRFIHTDHDSLFSAAFVKSRSHRKAENSIKKCLVIEN